MGVLGLMNITVLCAKACQLWGYQAQFYQAIEECAELIVAINHFTRYKSSDNLRNVAEEIVDVEIMLEQLKYMLELPDSLYESVRERKINRLKCLIAKDALSKKVD